ncbi:GNAT family N-acetyltransferase [Magnetofaba australis]|uniref:Putative N-acetyltransferase GCN5 n=1 Tax=Magnetofaba australis IT-1 TaxID=1434232 RepID=A0A1Y2JZZ9_9PROT|nr:GNAT family N-acetyltransferase [Magnetofaba australis]OSM01351.1 putative N-acetyltransferase GCN5 [Magnetofaba australis IT-1]
MPHTVIRRATPADAEALADLVQALTDEIIDRTGAPHFAMDRAHSVTLARQWLQQGRMLALLACAENDANVILGCALFYEAHALYAQGVYGVLSELITRPAARSQGIGAVLLDAAQALGQERGWVRIETTTPPMPAFERTLDFYQRQGFEITGGPKLKKSLG